MCYTMFFVCYCRIKVCGSKLLWKLISNVYITGDWSVCYAMLFVCYCRGDIVGESHEPNLVQQLKLELNHKNLIISPKHIRLSKIVGQGK